MTILINQKNYDYKKSSKIVIYSKKYLTVLVYLPFIIKNQLSIEIIIQCENDFMIIINIILDG